VIDLGWTATRKGLTKEQLENAERCVRDRAGGWRLHHGDCIGGDEEIHSLCLAHGVDVVIHPPKETTWRAFCEGAVEVRDPLPYLDRDQEIVNESTVLIAAPDTAVEKLRSGTWATVRRARRKRIPVLLLLPDGDVQRIPAVVL
jgi:hypothetical protein